MVCDKTNMLHNGRNIIIRTWFGCTLITPSAFLAVWSLYKKHIISAIIFLSKFCVPLHYKLNRVLNIHK